jgi:hypothetical protein
LVVAVAEADLAVVAEEAVVLAVVVVGAAGEAGDRQFDSDRRQQSIPDQR